MTISDINGKQTPLQIANGINWEKLNKAIIICEDENQSFIYISDMSWRDRQFLVSGLNTYLVAKEVLDLMKKGAENK